MGGLGNGRRGGRSPPLMIGALIACILVLGFNYWVSSSRNLELQEKLYDLEGQVRRGAAERGVAELKKNEFQEEIQRQKEQIGRIENLYKRQLDEAQSTCGKDKGTMQLNISSSAKTIQQLKGQLNQLNGDFGKLQKQLQSCQGNLNTLNKKLTYDMTQCNTQILSQKELCEERVAAAKLEIQKKLDKLQQAPGSSQVIEAAVDTAEAEKAGERVEDETKVSSVVNVTDDQPNEPSPLLTNEIIEDKGLEPPVDLPLDKVPPKTVSESVPQGAAVKHDTLPSLTGAVAPQEGGAAPVKLQKNNLTENKAVEVMDVHNEEGKNEETDPGVEDMLIGQDKADDNPIGPKVDEPEDYDGEEQMAGGVDLEKSQNQQKENIDKDLEEEVADYNGDDDNEGEFEADKQAELAQD